MKRIGLLGGMSWESSIEYYRLLNEEVRDRLGGLQSADCILRSVDFADIEPLQREARWGEAGERLASEACALVAAGAEILVLCTNTMHKVAGAVAQAIDIPMIHIADATAEAVRARGLATLGLLATAYTMEQDFYVGRLRDVHGLRVLVPDDADRRIVHHVIYDELCVGVLNDRSRGQYRRIMADLAARGAEGILLGCTEIELLIGPQDAAVPLFDTTRLHVQAALDAALEGDSLWFFRRLYDAFNHRDVDSVLAVMRDDVDWPNAWQGGRLVGRDAIRDYWSRQWAEIDPNVEPLGVIERSDGALEVTLHQVVRSRDGELLSDGEVLHVYRLEDGLIARMDVED